MKNWILTHKLLTVILACVIGVGAACAVAIPIALRHKHEFSAEWTTDENYHWHKCKDEKCKEVSDKAAHVFDKETVSATYLASEATYTEAAKYYKSCVCGVKGAETFDHGSSLSAKENVVELKDGVTLGKVYDGEAYALAAEEIARKGNGEVTIMYQRKGGVDFGNTAPKNVGEYTVKVSVAATAEWKEAEKTFDFAITAKPLTATATKEYDGNAVMPATLTGVIDGETVTATITMTSKNVGATVKEVTLEGADKDNYVVNAVASITPMVIGVDWEHPYDNKNIIKGEPAELLAGDEATIAVTMESANVGAAVQSFELTGKDAGNYSLAREDVTAEIVKADIVNFTISNAAAFEEGFYVGATNIPDPTTNYVEIGDGYGERTIVWEKQLEDGVWSRNLTKEEVRNLKSGTYRVRIQYDDGINYNYGKTEYVYFTVKAKPRSLTVKNFEGKTYDGKQVTNFTFNNLVKKFGATTPDGVENFTSGFESGEKYVEFREVGGEWGRNINVANVLTNAGEYEYRIGITATEEWEAVVSEVNMFTIKPYEFVLELGYVENQNNFSSDGGKTFKLRTFSAKNGKEIIEGQVIELWLNNEIVGLETVKRADGNYYLKYDQKKKAGIDSFFLKVTSSENVYMDNYTVIPKYSVTTVEMTVVEFTIGKSTSGPIQVVQPTEKSIYATVEKGYFMVGQTVVIYKSDGTRVGEATIKEISAGGGTSASGCAIPSDGQVFITFDQGFSDIAGGKIVAK